MNNYFILDSLNLLFLIALVVVTVCVMIYQGFNYCKNAKENFKYYSIFFLFFLSMVGALLSNHLGLTWVFVEATTLTSAYLIMLHKSKNSLEATWKYTFLCSIGISLAFVGIILLLIGSGSVNSLFYNDLYANATAINPFWLKLSFIFILIGFGTKAGFAPVHSWLPDAHAEAPSPVSAMLSATLLNSAVLVILRLVKLMSLAGLGHTVSLMLTMGLLSIFITAVYVYRINNYKRMLAYSSVENMGIIAIGIALGSLGTIGALIHVLSHSLIKSSLFLTSGNILHLYNTKEVAEVKNLVTKNKCTAWLWLLGAMLILAIPPSPLFLSEFLIIKQFLLNGQVVLCVITVLLLTIILYGIMSTVLKMDYSKDANKETEPVKLPFNNYLPQIFLIVTAIVLGIYMPNGLFELIKSAGEIIW